MDPENWANTRSLGARHMKRIDAPCDMSDEHQGSPWWFAQPDRLRSTVQLYAGSDPARRHVWAWERAAMEADDVVPASEDWDGFVAERARRYIAICGLLLLTPRDTSALEQLVDAAREA